MQNSIRLANRITGQARLPLSRIKGSVNSRNRKASQECRRFQKEFEKYCSGPVCKVNDFKKCLDNILAPHKINYIVEQEENEAFKGSLGTIIKLSADKEGNIIINNTGYKFLLPLDEEKEIILNKYTAMHETRHFFDRLYNPKQNILRCNNMINDHQYDNVAEEIRNVNFNNLDNPIKMSDFKTKTDKLLKRLPANIAIDVLQSVKYGLQSEMNAYKDEIKYMLKDGYFKDGFILAIFLGRNCKFKSKLKYVKNKLQEIIKSERREIKNRHFCQEIR